MTFECSNGSQPKPTSPDFIFIDAQAWICEVFPDGDNPLRNICIFFSQIADFLNTNPVELVAAAFLGFLTAQGNAVSLPDFCSVNPPPEPDEINVIDLLAAIALLPLDSALVDTSPVNLLQQKIVQAVARQKWFQYCECKIPEPDTLPPYDPLDPNPSPDPLVPPIPCPDNQVTVITTQRYFDQNTQQVEEVRFCFVLEGNGWTYGRTVAGRYVIYNTEYTGDWVFCNNSFLGQDYNKTEFGWGFIPKEPYRVFSGFGLNGEPVYDFNFDEVSPAEVFYLGGLGRLNSLVLFVPFDTENQTSRQQIEVSTFDTVYMACTYKCEEVNPPPPYIPEPDLDSCEVDDSLCKPKHGCKRKQVAVKGINECGESYDKLWEYMLGVTCATESVNVPSINECGNPSYKDVTLSKDPSDFEGGGI